MQSLGYSLIVLLLIYLVSCGKENKLGDINFLDIEGDSLLNHVFDQPEKYELQIRYVQIDRGADGSIDLMKYEYRVDSSIYFYPASTVKMPVAFLALEKLNKLYKKNIDIDFNTALEIEAPRDPPQTPVTSDSTSGDNLPSIGHYVHKVFLVSDNDAYNRLYEFVGPESINNDLRSKSIFRNSRIINRVGALEYSPEENRHTNPFRFYMDEKTVYEQPAQYMEPKKFEQLRYLQKGNGYIDNTGDLVQQPFDFSQKNFLSLKDLQESLMSVILQDGRFDLRKEDYNLLYGSMSMLPTESKAPVYPAEEYYDGYVKFFMFGDTKEPIPNHIRIFNKVGNAYGYLTDCAYIVDFKNNVEFFLTATIHVNANGIYNDGIYEYEGVGIPFLSALGRKFYEYELKRNRAYSPDLSRFKLVYN